MTVRKHNEFRNQIRSFYLRTQRVFEKLSARHNSTAARMFFLMHIAENENVRSADLIRDFALAPRTITEAIDALEAEGQIKRLPDPNDRRAKVLKLTEAGEKLMSKLEPERRRINGELLGALTKSEQAQFIALFAKLNERLIAIEARVEEEFA